MVKVNACLDKQRELHSARINLVEIDLLRGGERILSVRPEMLPNSERTTYQACVRRGDDPEFIDVYRIPLREGLPGIRIPLRPQDSDVALDLQSLIDQIRRKGRYGGVIDYQHDPEPPLESDDEAWAVALLRSRGLRPAASN